MEPESSTVFTCSVCPKKFSTAGYLIKHVKHRHPNANFEAGTTTQRRKRRRSPVFGVSNTYLFLIGVGVGITSALTVAVTCWFMFSILPSSPTTYTITPIEPSWNVITKSIRLHIGQTLEKLGREILPRPERLERLASGHWLVHALRTLVELDIPDRLTGAPKTAEELSLETRVDAMLLHRLLQFLAVYDVLHLSGSPKADWREDKFGLTSLSLLLTSQHPNSVRDTVLFYSSPSWMEAQINLLKALRTGKSVHEVTFHASFPDTVQRSSQDHASYESLRKQEAVNRATAFLHNFDVNRLSGLRLVDVQGGNGALLAAIMMRNENVSGVLCDKAPASVLEATEVKSYWSAPQLKGRIRMHDLDLKKKYNTSLPMGDVYILNGLLPSVAPDFAVLDSIRGAMPPNGMLIIIEYASPSGGWLPIPSPMQESMVLRDMERMLLGNGQENSEAFYMKTLGDAHFSVLERIRTKEGPTIFVARKALETNRPDNAADL